MLCIQFCDINYVIFLLNVPFRRQFQIESSFYKLFIGFVTGTGYCWCYCFNFFSVVLKADSLGLERVLDEQLDLTGRFINGMAHCFSVVFVSCEAI